ncbi:MAG: FAD binding domain-containing protein [Deltaproteobacteria bacterium]|nr:FAD binding domain-containing protein [Deltaproteobacteria bacterium]MBW1736217.1 FAD binding domain-containing protein [Deltaproteobacteria bacterium]MBW1908881.1 FAD binding domain-containing protein [Deltaproteobacteria bacterium]MBW2113481.1 FAD binding domain-containing protein [Deltaproteobacteria bacterium]MBW2358311.1 FAD binding domain-containing protein [Deltaproteobacteria bacterium]
MIDYDYKKPESLEEVFSLLKEYGPKATLIAGGTDVMVNIRNTKKAPEVLISLRGLKDLRYIKKNKGYHIGALTTHRMLELSELVKTELSALYDGASRIGSVQVRNVATIGGNICNAAPSADTAGPLLVLDAQVVLEGPKGRRNVPIAEFFTGTYKTVRKQGEVLVEFQIPAEMGHFGSAYWKHSRRKAMNLPILGIAVSLKLDDETITDARIGLTVAAPTPVRAYKAEEFLKGKQLTGDVLKEAGKIAASPECCSPRDSIRGEAWYRREIIEVYVARMARLAAEKIKNR